MRPLLGLALLLPSAVAQGHDDEADRLRLRPASDRGTLTGQLSQSPHRIAGREALSREQLVERVRQDVARSLRIEVDARPCVPRVAVRELWEPGGATAGDLVTLSCALDSAAQTLHVASHEPRLLEVTVELGQAEPARPVALVGANQSISLRLREPVPAGYGTLGAALLLGVLLTAAGYSRGPRSLCSTR